MKRIFLAAATVLVSLSACSKQEEPGVVDHSQHGTASDTGTGHSGMMAEMQKGNEISKDYDFNVTADKELKANEPADLNILVTEKSNGLPVRDFTENHEKLMHMIVISSDMAEFQHIHPDVIGPGKLKVNTKFPKDGEYIVFAQFAREGGHEATVRQPISVGNAKAVTKANLLPDADKAKVSDGYTYKLLSYPKKAGEMGMVTVGIEKDGKPVTGIENYLGAGGHAVVINEGTDSFLHVHPMTEAKKNGKYESPIEFHSLISKPGKYKLWGQFQIAGKVRTADFTFDVK